MGLNVLIADDEVVGRVIIKGALEKSGHVIIGEAKDGVELVELFRRNFHICDVVLSDIMMPNMSGLEAIREIKKIKRVIAVAVTAVDHGTRIEDNSGNYIPWTTCDFFISKPVNYSSVRDLLAGIERVIRNKI